MVVTLFYDEHSKKTSTAIVTGQKLQEILLASEHFIIKGQSKSTLLLWEYVTNCAQFKKLKCKTSAFTTNDYS